jgi:hypothetical protein
MSHLVHVYNYMECCCYSCASTYMLSDTWSTGPPTNNLTDDKMQKIQHFDRTAVWPTERRRNSMATAISVAPHYSCGISSDSLFKKSDTAVGAVSFRCGCCDSGFLPVPAHSSAVAETICKNESPVLCGSCRGLYNEDQQKSVVTSSTVASKRVGILSCV